MYHGNKIITIFNEYFKYDFHLIKLKNNSKKPTRVWKDEQNWIKDISQVNSDNIGIICDKIIVFDADTEEAITFLEQFDEIRETAIVKTKKGKHYYFLKSEYFTAKTEKIYKDNVKIDVKADNSYVVAPPSVIDSHTYTFERDLNCIKTLSFDEYEKLIYTIKDKLNLLTKQERETIKDIIEDKKIDLNKLKEILKKKYTEGVRQDIVLYTSAFLRKNNIDKETCEKFITEFCFETQDRDIKQRLSAVDATYKKTHDELKGFSGLLELGFDERELNSVFEDDDKYTYLFENFYHDENFLYLIKDKSKKMIGPCINIKSKIYNKNFIQYEIEHNGKTAILDEIKDMETIRRVTGKSIISESKFLEFLNYAVTQKIPEKHIRTETGWVDGIFYHPYIQQNDIWKNIIVDKKSYQRQNVERQHEFIQSVLLEGKKLAVAYVFSLASLLNEHLSTTPACLIISGKAGAGKTTMATLACNMFYDAERFNLSLNTTQNALELIIKQLKDITIMVDEAALKNIDLEKIVFMVSEKTGKARATRNLTVTLNNLCSNLILTSELDETTEFKRAGASRRVINLYITHRAEVSDLALHKYLNCTGAGLDIALFLQNFIKTEFWGELVEKEKEVAKYIRDIFNVALQMLVSVRIFEKFYNIELQHVYRTVCDLLLETEAKLYEKANNIQKFIDEFTQFVVRNHNKFVDKRNAEHMTKGEIYGQINSDNDFFILSKIFDAFCQDCQFHRKILLEELTKHGIIHPSTSGLRKTAKIFGQAVSVYHITLPND